MKIAGVATTSIKQQPFASLGLSRWKAIARVLLCGTLVDAACAGDVGIPGDQASIQGKETTANRSPEAKNQHRYTNRLIHEKSPYLLLHAHNPVDWYPWGDEAFAKAKRENKPIFLSVGYYTCHWCHVMEHESYSNPATAELLNRWFVSIKVDREERPDIHNEYTSFIDAPTGSGRSPVPPSLTPAPPHS